MVEQGKFVSWFRDCPAENDSMLKIQSYVTQKMNDWLEATTLSIELSAISLDKLSMAQDTPAVFTRNYWSFKGDISTASEQWWSKFSDTAM